MQDRARSRGSLSGTLNGTIAQWFAYKSIDKATNRIMARRRYRRKRVHGPVEAFRIGGG